MDYKKVNNALRKLSDTATKRVLCPADFVDICKSVNVCKMYYDIDLGYGRYTNPRTNKLIISNDIKDGKIILYDEGISSDLKLKYTYYYDDMEYVHAFIEFHEGIKKEDLELELDLYQFLADQMYIIVSRQNIRFMLDYAENYDIQTSIPNIYYLHRFYHLITKTIDATEYAVIFANLRNFKYINQTFGVRAGDNVMIKLAHTVIELADKEECVSRMGGDNYVFLVKKAHLNEYIEKLQNIKISGLDFLPNKSIDISFWTGISTVEDDDANIKSLVEQASVACSLGKQQLKKPVVFYDSDLAAMMAHSRNITAMFRPATENHEFVPFFQPKVNMLTGELIGMEALCRWKHDGIFIFPDQFIPVLDRQGLIHELDMTILKETCLAIRRWLDMGIEPPRVSFNISRKNLFVPDIEQKILDIVKSCNITTDRLETEITETAREDEIDRLISFLSKLKQNGMQIAIDDFGTGYSSLSLIHNINADIIKIDKSFVSALGRDSRSGVLIETIIQIADRLDMDVIAEGVETADEGRRLIDMGCINAQGYYYSKPVDFDTITDMIKNNGFKPIIS